MAHAQCTSSPRALVSQRVQWCLGCISYLQNVYVLEMQIKPSQPLLIRKHHA